MSSARGSENVTESGSDFFSVAPELAGLTRSGKKRLLPPEEPSADSLTVNLPGNQGVAGTRQSADSLNSMIHKHLTVIKSPTIKVNTFLMKGKPSSTKT